MVPGTGAETTASSTGSYGSLPGKYAASGAYAGHGENATGLGLSFLESFLLGLVFS